MEAFHGIHGGDIAKADLAICTMEKANALVNRMAKEDQVSPRKHSPPHSTHNGHTVRGCAADG